MSRKAVSDGARNDYQLMDGCNDDDLFAGLSRSEASRLRDLLKNKSQVKTDVQSTLRSPSACQSKKRRRRGPRKRGVQRSVKSVTSRDEAACLDSPLSCKTPLNTTKVDILESGRSRSASLSSLSLHSGPLTPPPSMKKRRCDRDTASFDLPSMDPLSPEELDCDLLRLHCGLTEVSGADALLSISQNRLNIQPGHALKERAQLREASCDLKPVPATRLETPWRPLPIGKPRVWAESRQELCESLPYFRSYQAGIYCHHNVYKPFCALHKSVTEQVAMGYLLDGFGSARDYIGCRVVISHGGGRSGNSTSGVHELISDQTANDKSVKALRHNQTHNIPLVLIMGAKCTTSPTSIPHRYCVLDWFRVSHIWTEKESDCNSHIRYKIRFEKLTPEAGWWSAPRKPRITSIPVSFDPYSELPTIRSYLCKSCGVPSPVVYTNVVCFNSQCSEFWKLETLQTSALMLNEEAKMSYQMHEIQIPFDLKPPIVRHKGFYQGQDVSRICWRGFCCPSCESRRIYQIAELRDPFRPFYTGPPVPSDWVNSLSKVTLNLAGHSTLRIARYFMGTDIGHVYHIMASDAENATADRLLLDYQSQEIDFRRRYMKTKVEGYFLSGQFSHNAGEEYSYHARTSTERFEDCAPVISEALELITERVQQVLEVEPFNEVLSITYFDGQKIDYHDDGEKGVEHTVASLSLGSSATMKFRPKKGCESRFFDQVPIFEHHDSTSSDQQILTKKPHNACRDILRLTLDHGDVVIMQGSKFQSFIEHAVVPKGLRVAATARRIIL